jgi:hypothetical protein
VFDALAASGQADSTVVAVFADHGYKLGEFNAWGKHSVLHADLHVPLLVRHPAMALPGAHSHAVVELVDVFPTLVELSLAGAADADAARGLAALPASLDGQSLAGIVLEGPWDAGRNRERLPSGGKEVAVAQYMPFYSKRKCMAYTVISKHFALKRWTNHRRFAHCPKEIMGSADLHFIQTATIAPRRRTAEPRAPAAAVAGSNELESSLIPFGLEHARNIERAPTKRKSRQRATAVRATMEEVIKSHPPFSFLFLVSRTLVAFMSA